jgi:predicted transcriptional regulator
MTKQDRETLERLTDFDYAWYKENVLDNKEVTEESTSKVEEPVGDYENIPQHHLAAIERGLADVAAGRMMSGEDFRKEMRAKFGL